MTTSQVTCSPPCHGACGSHRNKMRCRMPSVIQKMIRGRKKRLPGEAGTYFGHTTPTARMSVIISRRTRVSHSSHSFMLALCCIFRPRPASPRAQYKREKSRAAIFCSPASDLDTGPLVRFGKLSNEGEKRQIHGDDYAANHHAEENDHHWFHSGQKILDR